MITNEQSFSVTDWLAGRLPDDWFTQFSVTVDREEILVEGVIPEPESKLVRQPGRQDPPVPGADACPANLDRSRARVVDGRKVSWAVRSGDTAHSPGCPYP